MKTEKQIKDRLNKKEKKLKFLLSKTGKDIDIYDIINNSILKSRLKREVETLKWILK